jgi:hypothetical protein
MSQCLIAVDNTVSECCCCCCSVQVWPALSDEARKNIQCVSAAAAAAAAPPCRCGLRCLMRPAKTRRPFMPASSAPRQGL